MQFQVPQFIEVEDKIFGPLTFKQFLFMTGGAGLAFAFYVYLGFWPALVPMIIIMGFASALAFYKYNGRSFIFLIESLYHYILTKKLYIWKQGGRTNTGQIKTVATNKNNPNIPKLSSSRLEELSWSLDIKETEENNDE